MKRDNFTLPLGFKHELLIDNFAGGGGTSTGLEAAFGRPVDIAINHDPEALAMHALNHPYTRHYCESVWDVDPIEITGNQPVGLVWLSPDCKHFSKAKGGTPVEKHIRGLAWVGLRWIAKTKPRVLAMENVSEIESWGRLMEVTKTVVNSEGVSTQVSQLVPDPARKGETFKSFLRQLRAHGYKVEYRVLKACDNGAPTIRKRLFLIARRDEIPIRWPEQTHGDPTSPEVLSGLLAPWRTAAECIDFDLPSRSLFGRKKDLARNTQRRVAKGLWKHVLTSLNPYIVSTSTQAPSQVVTPFISEHANASHQRNMAIDQPLRTICAQVKGGHFSMVAPTLVTMHGTTESGLNNVQGVRQPLSTISAGGTHHALVAGHITKFNTGSIGYGLDEPMATITAGGTPARPSTGITQGLVGAHLVTVGYGERKGQEARTSPIQQPLTTVVAGGAKQAVVAAHLVDMGHGESCQTGAKRWSHGIRNIETPLNTITASGGTSALSSAHLAPLKSPELIVAACMEQANGGFYDGDGHAVDSPISTITGSGSNQRLVTAYCIKYYSSGGQWQGLSEPMHTLPTKGRLGLIETAQVSGECLTPEQLVGAKHCADLLHEHLPEHFPEPFDLVIVGEHVLVDISLRMLKPKELFKAQSFPATYIIDEIPDPKLLFVDGKQVSGDPRLLPRIPLTAEAQVRMCGNSVAPAQAEALARVTFAHELELYGLMAA
jgi:DNA (cytosine-5)-methyltransferase 1